MNKSEFVELVKEKGSYATNVEAETALNSVLNALEDALAKRESVSIVGFGTFDTNLRKGRSGKVPGTDKTYTSADCYVPRFRAGKILKDRVASGR